MNDDRIGRNNRIGTFAFQGYGLPAWHFQLLSRGPSASGGLPARSRLAAAGRILEVEQTALDAVDVGGRSGRRLDGVDDVWTRCLDGLNRP
jgi:hypothetical protein